MKRRTPALDGIARDLRRRVRDATFSLGDDVKVTSGGYAGRTGKVVKLSRESDNPKYTQWVIKMDGSGAKLAFYESELSKS
jgi:transcription antitermination factor NusG